MKLSDLAAEIGGRAWSAGSTHRIYIEHEKIPNAPSGFKYFVQFNTDQPAGLGSGWARVEFCGETPRNLWERDSRALFAFSEYLANYI